MSVVATSWTDADRLIRQAHLAGSVARESTMAERSRWLIAIAERLEHSAVELSQLAHEETHLTIDRLRAELRRTTFQLRLFADEILAGNHLSVAIDHADPAWPMGPRPDLRRMMIPLGVVGVFGASNFPFAFSVMGGDSASALAAGCAVVHKIHSAHQRLGRATELAVLEALAGAGAPDGLFSAVVGRESADALVDHPLVKAIGFTGSTHGGRALFDRAQRRPEPIPFFGELGSINPVVVTAAAWEHRAEDILAGYAASFTLGMGQFCTKPGLLFVPQTSWEALAQPLQAALQAVVGTPMLSPVLRESFQSSVDGMIARPRAKALVVGTDDEIPMPTVIGVDAADALADHSFLNSEMFGPASVVIRYRDLDELYRTLETVEGQLTATVQAEDGDELDELITILRERSGRILWNEWPTGVTVSFAQQHGGPYPATTASGTTSVGTASIARFLRPVAYQSFPDGALPPALQEANPWNIVRRVDGVWQPTHTGTT